MNKIFIVLGMSKPETYQPSTAQLFYDISESGQLPFATEKNLLLYLLCNISFPQKYSIYIVKIFATDCFKFKDSLFDSLNYSKIFSLK